MKLKFTTFDIKVLVSELSKKLVGMRVNNVYDIDSKTFLIKLNRTDEKAMLLLESGIRLHCTEFEWPKNIMPSGFAMKLRKHIKGRRLEFMRQLGVDRIIDMQFGSGEAAYHVILEMYDRGNIVLTDFEYNILNIQRPRTDNNQDVKFMVRERYPLELAKLHQEPCNVDMLCNALSTAKIGENLKKILNPLTVYGGHMIEHCLMDVGIQANARVGHEVLIPRDIPKLMDALSKADTIMNQPFDESQKGYIITVKEEKSFKKDDDADHVIIYSEFHPYLFNQHKNKSFIEFQSFDQAIDEFFSKLESQKQDRKLLQQESNALKKLDHIKTDHLNRIQGLKDEQMMDMKRARLIELNLIMVDQAITLMRQALAQQVDWSTLKLMVEDVGTENQVLAAIKSLKLDVNHISMLLKPPQYLNKHDGDDEDHDDDDDVESYISNVTEEDLELLPMKIDIDLGLSAYANARRYFDMKRQAAMKEFRTLDASTKAYKSAEKKTMQTLKEVQKVATINKSRKTHWFEKFLWFISSENYVVVGGRDQQQNEFIVKKYLKPGDIYVHADLHGASSVVIKNPTNAPVPPVTLNEAGTMALCNSAAWEARVVTSSWWVYHHQVSKTAPTGEYLTTGSFMIRGKKNYLPPSNLIYGFAFLFKVDESCLHLHRNERRIKGQQDDSEVASVVTSEDVELFDDEHDDDDDNDVCGNNNNDNNSSNEKDDTVKTSRELNEDKAKEIGDENGNDYEGEVDECAKNDDGDDSGSDDNDGEGNDGDDNDNGDDDNGDNDNGDDDNGDDNDNGDDDEEENVAPPNVGKVAEVNKIEDSGFPDTEVKYHFHDPQDVDETPDNVEDKNDEPRKMARLSAKQRRDMKKDCHTNTPSSTAETTDSKKALDSNNVQTNDLNCKQHQGPLKRRQKGKLKKIKEKYGDQDDEEREMRIMLLASNKGPNEEKLKKKNKGKSQQAVLKKQQNKQKNIVKKSILLSTVAENDSGDVIVEDNGKPNDKQPVVNDDDDVDQEEEIKQLNQELNLLDSLTGIPHAEDILLYCVPVCAPYNAIINYKFKVKLTPGTTKRGKAAKMALAMFMQDKTISLLEKDLLRSVKDTDLSRNMPGKVKVSITKHLTKHKK